MRTASTKDKCGSHKLYGTNDDVRMNFENPVRLDISHSKTLHVISFVTSNTAVQEARYTLYIKSLTDLST